MPNKPIDDDTAQRLKIARADPVRILIRHSTIILLGSGAALLVVPDPPHKVLRVAPLPASGPDFQASPLIAQLPYSQLKASTIANLVVRNTRLTIVVGDAGVSPAECRCWYRHPK